MVEALLAYPDTKSFQSMLEALSKIVDEASMHATSEGVRLVALDPAQVALLRIELPSEAFTEVNVEGGEEAVAGFNVSTVAKILKRGKKGDTLRIRITDDKVTWTIEGAAVKKYTLLNLDVPEPEVPEAQLDFKAHIAMIVDPFKNILKDLEAVADTVELEATEEALIVRGVGAAATEARIERDAAAVMEFEVKEPCKSAYSVEYLKNILSLTKVADTVIIDFGQDMPLQLKFTLPGGGQVTYLLAPKAV